MKHLSVYIFVLYCFFLSSCSTKELELIPVKSGEKWGYINSKGEYIINPQFDEAYPFTDNVAMIKLNDKVGYIDNKGYYIIPAIYKGGTMFSDGLAFVVSEGSDPICIDKQGEIKFCLSQAKKVYNFSEGLACFLSKDKRYGFVNTKGEIIITPQFLNVKKFSEGLCAFKDNNNQWGYMNKAGEIVIFPQFNYCNDFFDGVALFDNGERIGFIDKKGKYVINPQFRDAADFSEGFSVFKSDNGICGYIDKKGNITINPQFEDAGNFKDGLAVIELGKKYGYIDKNGKIVINPQFDIASDFFGNKAFVKCAGKYGIINKSGQYIANPQFEEFHLKNNNKSVCSDFYDVSTCITTFLKKDANGIFDEIDTTANLFSLVEHSFYGDCINDSNQYSAVCNEVQELDENISINKTTFKFEKPIYSLIPKYLYQNGYKYSVGEEKYYNTLVKLESIKYDFKLTGDANKKSFTIANAFKTKIEKKNHTDMLEKKGENHTSFFSEEGKYLFIIKFDESDLSIFVCFNKNVLQELLNSDE